MKPAELKKLMRERYRDFLKAAEAYQASIGAPCGPVDEPHLALIQECVCDHYRIHLDAMSSKNRSRGYVQPRQVAISIACELTHLSQADIGRAFGGRDHGTIAHCRVAVDNRVATEKKFKDEYASLLDRCRTALRTWKPRFSRASTDPDRDRHDPAPTD